MSSKTGQIEVSIGNAVRVKIVEWCSSYKHSGREDFKFYNVNVRVNTRGAIGEYGCAIRFSGSFGGSVDKLLLQRDLLKMAETMRSEFSIVVDHLDITSSGDVYMGFLGPDGERIPVDQA